MTARFRFNLMSVTILAVLVVNSFWTIPVLADDGTPPPAETPIETPAPPTEEPTPIAEQLQELPEGTEVVVLNEEGEVLPLASNEASQVIHNNDPMWCPTGVVPGGAGCTTPGQTSFAGLLAELSTYNSGQGPNKAGVIWIAGGYDSGTDDALFDDFTLDGVTLLEMAKYALTIQGGWIGTMGSKLTNQLDPSEFNASLSILNWTGAVTLNDILIDGATENPNTGSSTTSALIVQTAGAITVNRVQVINSGTDNVNHPNFVLNGADLDNTSSTTFASVTVNESIFNSNDGSGLLVHSDGAITIRNLTANGNGLDDGDFEYGAFISNWGIIDANKPITLSGINQFKSNLGSGLYITSFGIVTLNNITAYANDDGTDEDLVPFNGDEGDGSGVIVAASASIKMSGTNLINYNQVNGLDLSSDGTISLNNVNASNNGLDGLTGNGAGAVLDNCINAPLAPCTILGKAVTLTGTNVFNNNGFEGLVVQSGGAITISNITASGNGSFGAFLDNCVTNGTTCNNALRSVSITTPATFFNNTNDGLHLVSSGAVTLKGITANSNNGEGVYIDNRGSLSKPQNVTFSGTNVMNGNDDTGLRILSYGSVALANVTASDNGQAASEYGVSIDNRAFSTVPNPDGSILITRKPITFTGNNTFNNNFSGGLYLWSVGDVTLNNITAIGNGLTNVGDGVHIENEVAWYPNGVSQTAYAAKVTLNGFGIFEGNGDEGLQIFSRGAIKLSNVTANNNLDVGVWASNSSIDTMSVRQPITLTGINTFNNNDGGGTMLYSFGAVTLSKVTAIGNTGTGGTGVGDGVYIQNYLSQLNTAWSPNGVPTAYAANVILSGYGIFTDNADEGLDIASRGAVTLSNLTANDNVDVGVYVSNANTPGMLVRQAITFSGINTFNNNDGGGAMMFSFGAVTLSNVTAIGNTGTGSTGVGDGVYINNDQNWLPNGVSTSYAANIIISGYGYFEDNSEDGLDILSKGMVTLAAITANGNLDDGVFMNNVGDSIPQNVTFTGFNNFNGNSGDGLIVQTDGKITISNLSAIGNTGNGAWLDNFTSAKPNKFMGVTLTGVSSFQLNQGANGLYIVSDGIVMLSNINADDNAANGVQVDTTKALTIMCANAFSNGGTGFLLDSTGLMTLKGVSAYDNVPNENLTYGTLARTWACP